jgi:hypothetical protein
MHGRGTRVAHFPFQARNWPIPGLFSKAGNSIVRLLAPDTENSPSGNRRDPKGYTHVNKQRRAEDRYHTLRLQSRLWTALHVAIVLVPELLAVAIGYALGPYVGPLF